MSRQIRGQDRQCRRTSNAALEGTEYQPRRTILRHRFRRNHPVRTDETAVDHADETRPLCRTARQHDRNLAGRLIFDQGSRHPPINDRPHGRIGTQGLAQASSEGLRIGQRLTGDHQAAFTITQEDRRVVERNPCRFDLSHQAPQAFVKSQCHKGILKPSARVAAGTGRHPAPSACNQRGPPGCIGHRRSGCRSAATLYRSVMCFPRMPDTKRVRSKTSMLSDFGVTTASGETASDTPESDRKYPDCRSSGQLCCLETLRGLEVPASSFRRNRY